MKTQLIDLSKIRIDGGTQSREALSQATVDEYAEAMTEGASFPPVVVFFDGVVNWLGDGFHRFFGAKKIGAVNISADVREGTQRDAKLYSWGANDKHGLPRSNTDKRSIVTAILNDEEGRQWSDNKIAKDFGFSHTFVGNVRRSLETVASEKPANRTYTTKHGTTAVMKTNAIGRTSKAKSETETVGGPRKSVTNATTAVSPSTSESTSKAAEASDIPAANEADGGQSLDELIAEIQKENEELHARLKAMESDDTKAELHKALLQRDHAVRQQSEAMDKARHSEKREAWNKRQLMRCGKAVGQEDPDKIAAAVEAFVRQFQKAA